MKRLLLIAGAGIAITIFWIAFLVHDFKTTQVKTTATVTGISHYKSVNYPIFTYYDRNKVAHDIVSTEGYNNFNAFFMKVHIGEHKPVWYDKQKPAEAYIPYGVSQLIVWILPFVITIFVTLIWVLLKRRY